MAAAARRTPFVLASASPRRLALLAQAGLRPDVVEAASVDEAPQKAEEPRAYARRLARKKAEIVAARHAQAFVLAADTVVAAGRRILPKPANEAEARACLDVLSGRRHRVHTAICLIEPGGRRRERVVTTIVAFRRLEAGEIERYIRSGEWRDVAGGYALQGRAAAFIPWLNGSASNVIGLPLVETLNLLKGAGLECE